MHPVKESKSQKITITARPCKKSDMRNQCCCNCRHNIRIKDPATDLVTRCECDIDHHYISYIETFDGWCRHWSKTKQFDQKPEKQQNKEKSS